MKKILYALALIGGLLGTQFVDAQTYPLFRPANGILVGQTSTYVTTAANSSNVISLWSGTCNASSFLRGDGSCQLTPTGTVTSVGLTMPTGFSVSGSPITTSGSFGVTTALSGLINGTGSGFANATSANVIAEFSGTCDSTTYLRADGSCQVASTAIGANPTGTIGLTAVNGASTNFLRADGAPALSQAIIPTWTEQHTFSRNRTAPLEYALQLSAASPFMSFNETGAAANNRLWNFGASSEALSMTAVNDTGSGGTTFFQAERTGPVIDSVVLRTSRLDITNTVGAAPIDFFINDANALANERLWRFRGNAGGQLQVGAVNDALSTVNNFMLVDRAGATVDSVAFPTQSAGAFLVGTTGGLIANRIVSVDGGASNTAAVFKISTATNNTVDFWNAATAGDNIFTAFFTEASATVRGTISYNRGGGLVAYNTTSDARRKNNIVDAPSASALIDKIRIRSFDWKDSGTHLDYWVVAQELNEVVPMAVTVGSKDRDWAVDTSKLVPMLIKEVQDLRKRVADLEKNKH